MKHTLYLELYIPLVLLCILLTLGTIRLITPGIRKYFEILYPDTEIKNFFVKLVILAFFMSGLSAALSPLEIDDKSNWLTLSFASTKIVQQTISNLLGTLMTFTIAFLVLHLVSKLLSK